MDKYKKNNIRFIVKIVLPVCLILAGIAGWIYFKSKQPKMKRKPPKKHSIVVKTVPTHKKNHRISIHAMGTIIPDRQVILKSRISGEIVYISPDFVQGKVIKKGKTIVKIDDSDYKINVLKAESALLKALSLFAIEQGNQKIAKQELKLINKALVNKIRETDLALRKPQLAQAKALVDNARADLKKAKLNMARTKIITPFNAMILTKNIDIGSLVNVQGPIATIIAVDAYKIKTLIPPDMLGDIKINEKTGSKALVHSQYSDHTWQGKVIGTTGEITNKSRMAGIIVLVKAPLGLQRKNTTKPLVPMLLNDHVDVHIFGKTLKDVFCIPRAILRDNNTLWIFDNGTLKIKKVNIVWKEKDMVYIKSGITARDLLITSDMSVAVNGMTIKQAFGN